MKQIIPLSPEQEKLSFFEMVYRNAGTASQSRDNQFSPIQAKAFLQKSEESSATAFFIGVAGYDEPLIRITNQKAIDTLKALKQAEEPSSKTNQHLSDVLQALVADSLSELYQHIKSCLLNNWDVFIRNCVKFRVPMLYYKRCHVTLSIIETSEQTTPEEARQILKDVQKTNVMTHVIQAHKEYSDLFEARINVVSNNQVTFPRLVLAIICEILREQRPEYQQFVDSLTSFLTRYSASDLNHALRCAANAGNLEDVKTLVETFQADVNAVGERKGKSSLHFACEKERVLVVEYLLSKDANPELPDLQGNMPFDYGCSELNPNAISFGPSGPN